MKQIKISKTQLERTKVLANSRATETQKIQLDEYKRKLTAGELVKVKRTHDVQKAEHRGMISEQIKECGTHPLKNIFK